MGHAYNCHFSWNILNPSVPWQRMEATFYHCSPTLKQWKVTLQPRVRNDYECCDWPFTFSLQCVRSGDSDDIVVADRMEVKLKLNKGTPCIRKALDYSFRRRNQHSFKFGAHTRFIPTKKTDHLTVTVDISIPSTENLTTTYRVFNGLQLSEDLMRLFTRPLCSDLRLKSTDPLSSFPVHSYILHARWNNFFREHPAHTIVDDTVETDISNDVLTDILTYVYSGTLHDDNNYSPEMFQVMRRYELQHLYENFVNKTLQQERQTLKNVCAAGVSFDLHLGRRFKRTWHISPVTRNCEVLFRIEFFLSCERAEFSYTVRSRSPDRIYVRVHLKLVRRGVAPKGWTLDDRNYTIGGNETVDSGARGGRVNFIRSGAGIRYSVKWCVYLSDGTQSDALKNEYDGEFLDDELRFIVLGDHMSELLKEGTGADLRVVCRAEDPNNPDETRLVHKAIFATRVPNWRAVLQNVPEGNGIPDEVTCILSSEAFRLVIDYIYRSKMFSIPSRFNDEIGNFAALGGMTYWQQFVNDFRYHLLLNSLYPSI